MPSVPDDERYSAVCGVEGSIKYFCHIIVKKILIEKDKDYKDQLTCLANEYRHKQRTNQQILRERRHGGPLLVPGQLRDGGISFLEVGTLIGINPCEKTKKRIRVL